MELIDKQYINRTIIKYQGIFSIDVLTFLGKQIKLLLAKSPSIAIKVYKIFIELAQNISYYSAEIKTDLHGDGNGFGSICLQDHGKNFKLVAENLVYHSDGVKLTELCSEARDLPLEELRLLKRIKRREIIEFDDGTHIGLIHVGLLAENKIDFEIEPIDENYSYFTLTVDIDKDRH